jgi:hypothetical protein
MILSWMIGSSHGTKLMYSLAARNDDFPASFEEAQGMDTLGQ